MFEKKQTFCRKIVNVGRHNIYVLSILYVYSVESLIDNILLEKAKVLFYKSVNKVRYYFKYSAYASNVTR